VFFKPKSPIITEQSILNSLSEIASPGAIKKLTINGTDVSFTVEAALPVGTPPSQIEELKNRCEKAVRGVPGVTKVEVTLAVTARPTAPPKGARINLPLVKHVIAVASGKGGVGKSTVTINLAVALSKTGARVGLMDADIYGPSVPMMMGGVDERPLEENNKMVPVVKAGIKMMSMGFLVDEKQPVVWRGPMVHGALTQFMTQVEWGELDYLLIDMPPGTGDAQLTISQTAPLTGALIVTTPQDVSLIDARRGMMMFQSVKIPVLGVIENMSGYACPHCHEVSHIFRKGGGLKISEEMKVPFLGAVPIDPRVAEGGDKGTPIIHAHPDSEVALVFRKLADDLISQMAVLQAETGGAGKFQPLSLQWQ
jgi:ATP-binding protein involved in chromosome partitioning